jgi:hypothetical protein
VVNAELDAGGVESIDEVEQLLKPASQLYTRLPALLIVLGHGAQRIEMFGRRRNILRSSFSSIREDGACVEMAAGAMARRLTALAAQGVHGARQERRSLEAGLEQTGQELLGAVELRAEGAETMVHSWHRGTAAFCRSIRESYYRNRIEVEKNGKSGKKRKSAPTG